MIDVMHMFDEGVARYILEQLVERYGLCYSAAKLQKIEKKWLSIQVTGHNNRALRALTTYKKWKAHELRFFVQHGLPYVTKGIIETKFYEVFCLASRIAYWCTKDGISNDDITYLKVLEKKLDK